MVKAFFVEEVAVLDLTTAASSKNALIPCWRGQDDTYFGPWFTDLAESSEAPRRQVGWPGGKQRGRSKQSMKGTGMFAEQVTGAPRTTHLTLSRKGDRLLANCSDRVARLFDVAAPGGADPPQPFGAEAAASRVRTLKVQYLFLSLKSCNCILQHGAGRFVLPRRMRHLPPGCDLVLGERQCAFVGIPNSELLGTAKTLCTSIGACDRSAAGSAGS